MLQIQIGSETKEMTFSPRFPLKTTSAGVSNRNWTRNLQIYSSALNDQVDSNCQPTLLNSFNCSHVISYVTFLFYFTGLGQEKHLP